MAFGSRYDRTGHWAVAVTFAASTAAAYGAAAAFVWAILLLEVLPPRRPRQAQRWRLKSSVVALPVAATNAANTNAANASAADVIGAFCATLPASCARCAPESTTAVCGGSMGRVGVDINGVVFFLGCVNVASVAMGKAAAAAVINSNVATVIRTKVATATAPAPSSAAAAAALRAAGGTSGRIPTWGQRQGFRSHCGRAVVVANAAVHL